MVAIPEAFVRRMHSEIGEEQTSQLLAALEGDSPVSIRLNSAKPAAVSVSREVPWCRDGWYLDERPLFTLDPAFHAGCYYVQEAGSQFIDYLLQTECIADGRILDMCAAPGGKTTIYASAVGQRGLVVANEYVRQRANILADNVRKWGLGNTVVTNCSSSQVAELAGWFDVVAVDAPCSGEGMFRKDETARQEWSESAVGMCAARQKEILANAWQSLRSGGLLIYSTCTFNRTEDEGVLSDFVAEYGDDVEESKEVAVRDEWGIDCGKVGPFQTFRFLPHKSCSEGLFVAVARKSSHAKCGTVHRPKRSPMREVAAAERAELSRWVEGTHRFAEAGETTYAYAPNIYDDVCMVAATLNAIYSGVAMGRIFKGSLKPDWALSQYVGFNRNAVNRAEVTEEQALDFLRKRDIVTPTMQEGWNLVVYRDMALGFAKRIGARSNNTYPNSLRIMNL